MLLTQKRLRNEQTITTVTRSGAYAGHSVYAMTKGAMASLTRGLARDLGPRGITVNNVQPGRIDTELVRNALGAKFEEARGSIPVGGFGAVEDVAELVAFLAGPHAGFINGASLRIDGGIST
jgi:3-oxoacyl-[acyl-carrier protein] reductase